MTIRASPGHEQLSADFVSAAKTPVIWTGIFVQCGPSRFEGVSVALDGSYLPVSAELACQVTSFARQRAAAADARAESRPSYPRRQQAPDPCRLVSARA